MSEANDDVRQQVVRAWRAVDAEKFPAFTDVWRRAEARHAGARRRYRRVAVAAVLMAAVFVALKLQAPSPNAVTYIEVAELLGSTSWTAPSDVLLPRHEFDIYQELPGLLESTRAEGGSLL